MSRSTYYRGFNIEAAIAQLPDLGDRWNHGILISTFTGSATEEWLFFGPSTFATEQEAINNCFECARRIIDGEIHPPVVRGSPFPC